MASKINIVKQFYDATKKHYLIRTEHQAGKFTSVISVEMGVASVYFPDEIEEHTQY